MRDRIRIGGVLYETVGKSDMDVPVDGWRLTVHDDRDADYRRTGKYTDATVRVFRAGGGYDVDLLVEDRPVMECRYEMDPDGYRDFIGRFLKDLDFDLSMVDITVGSIKRIPAIDIALMSPDYVSDAMDLDRRFRNIARTARKYKPRKALHHYAKLRDR